MFKILLLVFATSTFITTLDCNKIILNKEKNKMLQQLIKPILNISRNTLTKIQNNKTHVTNTELLTFVHSTSEWSILDDFFGYTGLPLIYSPSNNNIHLTKSMKNICTVILKNEYYDMVLKIKPLQKKITLDTLNQIPKCIYSNNRKNIIESFIFDSMSQNFNNYNIINLISDLLSNTYSSLYILINNQEEELDDNTKFIIEYSKRDIRRYILTLCRIFDRLEKILQIYKNGTIKQASKSDRMKIFDL